MTKRKLLAIFFALAIGVSLTGCGNLFKSDIESDSKTIKETVSQEYGTLTLLSEAEIDGTHLIQYTFYDSTNMVMYAYFTNRTNGHKSGAIHQSFIPRTLKLNKF